MNLKTMLATHKRLITTLGDYGELNSRSLMQLSCASRNYKYVRDLLEDNLIEFYEYKVNTGKGRKQKIYRLTKQGYEIYKQLTDRTPIITNP